ncbi:MAG: hypothetical protein GF331_19040 [Chitinivibrionales bacterium]|nr:hypothetical protein [Chitinivibrionales bacterium]
MVSTKILRKVVMGIVACALFASAQVGYLYNTSFSVGVPPYGDPQDWNAGEVDESTGIWRDTEDFNSSPASLGVMRIDTGNGGSFNQNFRNDSRLPAQPGNTFTFDAMVRCDSTGGGSFQLVAHFSGGVYWEEIPGGWVTLYYGNSVDTDWKQVSVTKTVPDGATWGLFRIWTAGIITYHIDDIKINGEDEVVSVEHFSHTPAVREQRISQGKMLRVFRPDGRAVSGHKVGQVDAHQLVPGCYVITNSQNLAERVMTR